MSYGKLVDRHFVRGLFPTTYHKVQFAFVGNHINRYQSIFKSRSKSKPEFDLIMAVNNPKEFHEMNLADNKDHYTYFVRFM